jgi:hypothetical protein
MAGGRRRYAPRLRRLAIVVGAAVGAVTLVAVSPPAITPAGATSGTTGPSPRATGAATSPGSYALVNVVGDVSTFGGAHYAGDRYDEPINRPIVGATPTPDRAGYWLVASDGGVFSYGEAGFYGSTGGMHLNQPVVGMAATADGGGYWLVASDGGVFTFGDARFFGSTGGMHLNQPVVGMAAAADGGGYWLVASDGGVFTFGDARFFGSTGGMHLNRPIVDMAATADGGGYWLVASDGGVFTFGDAPFFGSTGGLSLAAPITGVATTPDGAGYMLVAGDGGVFTFGDAQFSGSAASDLHPPDYAAAFSSTPPGTVAGMYLAAGPVPSASGPVRVLLSGDSLSVQTALGWASVEQGYGARVESGGILGCGVGVTGATATASWNSSSGAAAPVWAACMNWQQHLHAELALSHPNVVVVLAGYWECQHWQYGGQWVTLADPSFQAEVAGQLTALSALVHSYGAELVLLSTPYFGDGTPNSLVDSFNSLLAQTPDAQVLDLHGLLDPGDAYAQEVDGIVARNNDGVHLSSVGPAQLMAPALLPPIVAIGSQTQ